MITFTDQYGIAKEISGLDDALNVSRFKRDINTGGAMFLSKLGRPYNRTSKFTSMVANQQFYQFPEDALRMSKVKVLSGTRWYNCEEIASESAWIQMNVSGQTSSIPTYFFVKGFDEVGLYPIPSGAVTSGIELVYEPKSTLLTQDDYTTGTLTVTNNSQTVVGVGTAFTQAMIGRWLNINDGTDGNWYKVSGFTSVTSISVENYYQGLSGSVANGNWRVGEVMKIPEEFQEAPVDYAMYRHFLRKNSVQKANEFKSLYEAASESAQDLYGSTTGNQVIYADRRYKIYNPLTDSPIINV